MDAYDRERAHHQAKQASRELYDQHYGDQEQYDPNQTDAPPQLYNQGQGGDGYGGGGYGGGGYGGGNNY